MRQTVFAIALALSSLPLTASADDVSFELDTHLFEEPAVVEENFALFSYDSPLYDGLWPMTREAFRASDFPVDKEVFTFSIASNR